MSSLFDHRLGKLIESADEVVNKHCGLRANGEVSSHRTQEFSRQVIRETCRRLHRLGYRTVHLLLKLPPKTAQKLHKNVKVRRRPKQPQEQTR